MFSPFCSQFLSRGCAHLAISAWVFAGESIKSGRNRNSAKRFTGDIKENKDKKCKNGRVSSLLYHISKLTIPFLCPHKILSSSYAMFVLLYPLYYLYLTNCNTLVRNNKRSLPLLLYLIVSLMLKHDHVQVDETATPLLAAWERGVSTPKDRLRSQTNHHLYGTNPKG